MTTLAIIIGYTFISLAAIYSLIKIADRAMFYFLEQYGGIKKLYHVFKHIKHCKECKLTKKT